MAHARRRLGGKDVARPEQLGVPEATDLLLVAVVEVSQDRHVEFVAPEQGDEAADLVDPASRRDRPSGIESRLALGPEFVGSPPQVEQIGRPFHQESVLSHEERLRNVVSERRTQREQGVRIRAQHAIADLRAE